MATIRLSYTGEIPFSIPAKQDRPTSPPSDFIVPNEIMPVLNAAFITQTMQIHGEEGRYILFDTLVHYKPFLPDNERVVLGGRYKNLRLPAMSFQKGKPSVVPEDIGRALLDAGSGFFTESQEGLTAAGRPAKTGGTDEKEAKQAEQKPQKAETQKPDGEGTAPPPPPPEVNPIT